MTIAGLFQQIAKAPVPRAPPGGHPGEHLRAAIDIIDDENVRLAGMLAVQATDILRERVKRKF